VVRVGGDTEADGDVGLGGSEGLRDAVPNPFGEFGGVGGDAAGALSTG
jgi:hypothetical protein